MGTSRTSRWLAAALGALALAACACTREEASKPAPSDAGAVPPSAAAPAEAPQAAAPGTPVDVLDPNPLRLPPRKIKLDAGRRVFTFSDQMLRGARIGSTLILYAATVMGFDGDDLVIENKTGPSYKVHAGYVIAVPDDPKIKPMDPVVTEWNGVLKHAVVTKLGRDKLTVRYTDMDPRAPAGQLKHPRIIKQLDGLLPGNYAALTGEKDEWRHVLLVSPVVLGEQKRWFALGFGGAAMVVDEAALRPIPVKWSPKPGTTVLAEWVGALRKATVSGSDDPGFVTVRYERAGRPATLGWGRFFALPEP